MTTLEQEAREKAQDALAAKKGMDWTENAWLYGEGYEHGYLAAAEPRERRIAELEAKVPRWVTWDSDERRNLVKAGWGGIGGDELIDDKWHRLMVPPIPLPGEER